MRKLSSGETLKLRDKFASLSSIKKAYFVYSEAGTKNLYLLYIGDAHKFESYCLLNDIWYFDVSKQKIKSENGSFNEVVTKLREYIVKKYKLI